MKLRITMKDPDGCSESVRLAVEQDVKALGLDEDETEALVERRTEKAWKALERWVEYQEYVSIDVDTDAGTATVVRRGS